MCRVSNGLEGETVQEAGADVVVSESVSCCIRARNERGSGQGKSNAAHAELSL